MQRIPVMHPREIRASLIPSRLKSRRIPVHAARPELVKFETCCIPVERSISLWDPRRYKCQMLRPRTV